MVDDVECRTDWGGRSMDFPKERHPAYDHVDAKERMNQWNGCQKGDPEKGAKVMYDLAVMEDPPLRCLLGTNAFKV